jgi:hypothetical protein
MTRVQRETTAYIAIAVACIAMLIWVIPAFTPPYPGYGASPALVPNVAVGLTLVMAVLELIRAGVGRWSGRARPAEETQYPEDTESGGFSQLGRLRLGHLARFMIPCALLLPAMEWIGFLPSSVLFLLAIQVLIGGVKPVRAVVLALVVAGLMYAAIRYGFNVPVPGPYDW